MEKLMLAHEPTMLVKNVVGGLQPLGLLLALSVSAAAQTVSTIDVPDSTATIALDINDAGTIVGRYASAIDGQTHGFLRTIRGGIETIDVPGAVFTVAAGINNDGAIVGQYRLATDSPPIRRGFLLTRGQFINIEPPGSIFTNVLGISRTGVIVGRFCTTVPCTPESASVHGFVLTGRKFTTFDVPGAHGTNAWKVSPQGYLLGGDTDADGSPQLFMTAHDGVKTIDLPPGLALALDNGGLNPEGDIVASYCDQSPCLSGATNAHGLLLTGGVVSSVDVPGARFTGLFSINARRAMVGLYGDANGRVHGVLLTRR